MVIYGGGFRPLTGIVLTARRVPAAITVFRPLTGIVRLGLLAQLCLRGFRPLAGIVP